MTVSLSVVETSHPDGLTDAAGRVRESIAHLDTLMARQRLALADLRANWQGKAAAAATARAETNLDRQEELAARLQAVQSALQTGGAQLSSTGRALLMLVTSLRATGWQVADDGTCSPPPYLPPVFTGLAPAWTAVIGNLLAQYDEADRSTAAAVAAALDGPLPQAPPATLDDPRQLPGKDTAPDDVNRWWDALSQAERDALIAAHPPELGNLSGIPAGVRDRVNRAVMTDDLNRVRDVAARNGVGEDDVLADPARYGLTQTDATRFHNARRTGEGLAHQRGPNPKNPRPVMLWGYQPLADNGQGRAAIAIGDPDTAENTAVIVPGTGSSVRDGWLADGRNDAITLYDQARLADPDDPTAVIMWMGYDAPDGFTDTRIATPGLARAGGDLLAADVNGLAATHTGPSHVTVIGHSYGSTTVADAFAGSGMRADDAVLIGSPGTDLAKSAADFHLDGGKVYVGAASTDPVSWIGTPGDLPADVLNRTLGYPVGPDAGLGTDPAGDEFGSVRFRAEVAGEDGLDVHDHSHYYDRGSESMRAITDIASGNSHRLAEQDLLAEGRRQPHLTTPDHLDLPFGGRIPLPHIDTDIPGSPAFIDPEAGRPGSSVTTDHDYKPTG
ncbi:alpha/beta hydrolase [Mycobacterium sp. IS-1742]|uniref:alpha/beta hydrolase n=1 Tax=Mycobacterium sp. IS-1742 TaxID=1772285 RepID=UPI0007401B6D|nr:alpha/beta hydrolase [Mycobacterium sp. IS-1742]KUI25814.1 alpha/beta hydrolase [Mycobacterium sp. IS-1742]